MTEKTELHYTYFMIFRYFQSGIVIIGPSPLCFHHLLKWVHSPYNENGKENIKDFDKIKRRMSNNRSSREPESYTMNGGKGAYSCSNNSSSQRASIEAAKDIIDEAISKELDLTKLSLTSNAFSIVDLGCSTGPNTFIAVQNILDSIKQKYQSLSLDSEIPEFLVYFNDLTSNDFNTLFASLPPNGQYFAAAVPGSFHGRLFPESSIHFFHSSSALHWLSKVPDECLDKNYPAWNKGRVHYTNAGSEVYDAYAAQFAEDMGMFLEARAKEIVFGGMMALILSGIESGMCHSKQPVGLLYDLLGASLMDLAEKGVISEEEVDSFNLPLHTATPEEMREIVERNGSFSLVRMEMMESKLMMDAFLTNVLLATMILRSNTEDIISKHFGSGVMDEVCQRFSAKALDIAKKLNPEEYQGYHLLVILKRN